jgi:AraC-like DNA-binding protein
MAVRESMPICAAGGSELRQMTKILSVYEVADEKCIKEVSAEVGISVASFHGILRQDLNMHYLYQHFFFKKNVNS